MICRIKQDILIVAKSEIWRGGGGHKDALSTFAGKGNRVGHPVMAILRYGNIPTLFKGADFPDSKGINCF